MGMKQRRLEGGAGVLLVGNTGSGAGLLRPFTLQRVGV